MLIETLAVLAGFAALVWGADRFIAGASATARLLGASPLLIGLTIVGIGTSAPEIVVSAVAAFNGKPALGVGNAIGSNITNIALVLGAVALFKPLSVHSSLLRRELPLLLFIGVLALALCFDDWLSRIDGVVLLLGLVLLLTWMTVQARRGAKATITREFEAEIPDPMPAWQAATWLAVGLIVLPASSQALVWGATRIAMMIGVSDLVIGLTIVAIGTSLPELAASLAGVLKEEHDIALGNVIGSNMFNLLVVLAMPALIAPGALDAEVVTRDLPIMLALTVALAFMCKGLHGAGRITRLEGGLLLAAFIGYQLLLYYVFR